MMIFLQPMFLWIAGAAVVPLVLHLVQKNRIRTTPFGSIRFLRMARKRSVGRARLRHFLLWLARTLVLLLIAGAFASPVVRTNRFAGLTPEARQDVAIVWDVSFSMSYTAGERDVWRDAKETVLAVIKGLNSADRVCVFLAGDDVTALIAQPTSDHQLAAERVSEQRHRNTASRLGPAIEVALKALADSGAREKELVIVSDGQAVPWADVLQSPPAFAMPRLRMFVALLGAAEPRNVAPVGISLTAPVLQPDTPSKLSVSLFRTGESTNTTLGLWVDGQEVCERHVALSEGQPTTVELMLPNLSPGVHPAHLVTSTDPVDTDNRFFFLLRCRERPSLLCVGHPRDVRFLTRALAPTPELAAGEVTNLQGENLQAGQLHRFSCVFLCNALPMDGRLVLALEEYVKGGGVLVVFPGDGAVVGDYQSWGYLPAVPQRIAVAPGTPERLLLRVSNPHDEIMGQLRVPPGSAPHVAATQMLDWGETDGRGQTLVTAGGCPFLAAGAVGDGRVLLFAVPADRTWSDFPMSPLFLPIVHQIAHFAALRKIPEPCQWVGDVIPLPEHCDGHAEGVVLTPGGLERQPRRWMDGGRTRTVLERVEEPGIYAWQATGGGSPEPILAVNASRQESNLARIDPRELMRCSMLKEAKIAADREELLRLISEHRTARSLVEPFLWLALTISAVEFAAANALGRRAAPTDGRVRVDDTGRVEIGIRT